MTTGELTAAMDIVHAAGFVTVRTRSYYQAQERQRTAKTRATCEAEARARTELWAQQAFKEQARLADRLTYVYGAARAAGLSIEDLRQPQGENC